MGDIVRSGNNGDSIIAADIGLTLKRMKILISEKENQLDGITVRINTLKAVEIKQLELQQDVLVREVQMLKEEAGVIARQALEENGGVIDAEFEVKEEKPSPVE
jgi:hypothetical protein